MPVALFPSEHATDSLEVELLHQVQKHRSTLARNSSREISLEEAFDSWGQTVFGPLSSAIEEEGLDKEFSEVGEDELFLRVNRHWHWMKRDERAKVSPRDAVFDFGAQYATREDARTDFRLKKLFFSIQPEGFPPARLPLKEILLHPTTELDSWDLEILHFVENHRPSLGANPQEFSWNQGFDSWYETVFVPLCRAIDEEFLDLEFSGLSQVELFVLVCRHGQMMSGAPTMGPTAKEVVKNYKALFAGETEGTTS